MLQTERFVSNIYYRNEFLTTAETGNYFEFGVCFMKLDTSVLEVMNSGNDNHFHIEIDLYQLVTRGNYLSPTMMKVGRVLFVLYKKGKEIFKETFSTTFTNAEFVYTTDKTKINPYKFKVVEKEGVYYFLIQAKRKTNNQFLYAEITNRQAYMYPSSLFVFDSSSNHPSYAVDLLPEQIIDVTNNDYRNVNYTNYAGETLLLSEIDSYGLVPEKGIGYILDTYNSNKLIARINDNYYLIPMMNIGTDLSKTAANTIVNGVGNLKENSVGANFLNINLGRPVWWTGSVWKEANGALMGENGSGTWVILTGQVLTNAVATYDKWGKQVALSGSLTFATANTDVAINLPFAPDFGCSINIGNLTFTLNSGSTTASVKSSITGAQGFQINYKTA